MTQDMIKKEFITVGDAVLLLGYPLNLIEAGHVIPIARGAVLRHPLATILEERPPFLWMAP